MRQLRLSLEVNKTWQNPGHFDWVCHKNVTEATWERGFNTSLLQNDFLSQTTQVKSGNPNPRLALISISSQIPPSNSCEGLDRVGSTWCGKHGPERRTVAAPTPVDWSCKAACNAPWCSSSSGCPGHAQHHWRCGNSHSLRSEKWCQNKMLSTGGWATYPKAIITCAILDRISSQVHMEIHMPLWHILTPRRSVLLSKIPYHFRCTPRHHSQAT